MCSMNICNNPLIWAAVIAPFEGENVSSPLKTGRGWKEWVRGHSAVRSRPMALNLRLPALKIYHLSPCPLPHSSRARRLLHFHTAPSWPHCPQLYSSGPECLICPGLQHPGPSGQWQIKSLWHIHSCNCLVLAHLYSRTPITRGTRNCCFLCNHGL